ncbi:mediator of RNA polymerase II transcription subunit 30 [Episyrphus balteatus]|uniref:mediator of RNA polymerase II transcription subunit 30 n=1 Tax=Episyrphus balteatus TaxID=286459 RepID=UPI0024866ADB|nr:mediator of RNA polymerase II transcription subunit 30 [Episyrphus balteatus]
MSGQYPGGYNNPVGPHRTNFANQMVNMNQMVPNQMAMMGGYNQATMMQQSQQQPNSMQNPGIGGIIPPVMNPPGMPSPSHAQQAGNSLVQQQMHQQQIQQQQMQQQQLPQTQQQSQPQPQNPQQAPQLTLQTPSTPTSGSVMMTQPSAQTQPQVSNMQPPKEINIVGLSRLGQETVQDITSRFQEIFAALKIIQPTCNRENNTEKKVQEYFRTIRLLFKRVRIIYEKCNDGYPQGMEYTHIESLIPYKDEPDHRSEPTHCEEYRKAMQENRELIETVMLKNKQLREIIDRTRIIIWEINTMLSMRRS